MPVELFQNLSVDPNEDEAVSRKPWFEKLAAYAELPIIREAIAVSSLPLLQALPNLTNQEHPRKQDQAVKGFLRYLLRMTSRPTPFGLFSGVTYGNFGERYAFELQPVTAHTKRARPDMEWLLKVLSDLESRFDVVMQLKVSLNCLAYPVGSRLYLPYLTKYGVKQKSNGATMESTSVRLTPAVKQVMELTRQPLPFGELALKLHSQFSDTSLEQINQFLWQLVQQEIIITDLRPPLMTASPFDYVLRRLADITGVEDERAKLETAAALIASYNRTEIGQGEPLYHELVEHMKSVAEAANLLQVDLALSMEALTLPKAVAQEIERVGETLWRISGERLGLSHLESYRADFMEKYGAYREVPLLELLDADIGLGAPAGYEYPRSKRKEDNTPSFAQQKKKMLLTQWVMTCLQQGRQELELTDDMVMQLEPVPMEEKYAPRSLELYFGLAARSGQAVEEGDFLLIAGGTTGTYGAGKSVGRFVDLFDSSFVDKLKQIDRLEQKLHPDAILAELVYFPGDGRAANVALSTNIREYEIDIGTNSAKDPEHTIPLSDLVVGISASGFYLRSLSKNRRVIPVTNHMLNTSNSPNVYRFLRELSMENQRNIDFFEWNELRTFPFLPRLRYSKTIIAAACWKFNADMPPFHGNMTETQWRQAFEAYRKQWNVPRFVYLTQSDNRLLLDLDSPLHRDEVYRDYTKLQPGGQIVLTETGFAFEHLPESAAGRYVTEFVFPLVKRDLPQASSQPDLDGALTSSPIRLAERLKMPGSEWLYLKWYGADHRADAFIGGPLLEFCRQAEEQGWAAGSFFMRYADPDPHLRWRFCGHPEQLHTMLLPQLYRFTQQCVEDGLLSRLVIDTYDPEIERYGGRTLIGAAERLFCLDSRVVAEWIYARQSGHLSLNPHLLAVISVIDMMERFGLSFFEQFEWLNTMVQHKEHLELFRQHRPFLMKFGDARGDFAQLRHLPDGAAILPMLHARGEAITRYVEGIRLCQAEGTLTNTQEDLIQSVIHMHLNRLFGIQREEEQKVLTLARHTLYSLQHVRRNQP
ncbi:lantibiotic dehydratase [Paenibacillus sp. SM 69]|nr:lantibiotic dehydratase [Paenibacillus oleatilyticus]